MLAHVRVCIAGLWQQLQKLLTTAGTRRVELLVAAGVTAAAAVTLANAERLWRLKNAGVRDDGPCNEKGACGASIEAVATAHVPWPCPKWRAMAVKV